MSDVMQNKVTVPPFDSYTGDEPYLFISYAHKDSELVFKEIRKFNDLGYHIWYDEGIDPGNEWPDEIATALDNSSFFIVFISPNSVVSKNVRNEINFALNKNKPFLAIYIQETLLPIGLELNIGSIQAIMRYRMDENSYLRKINKLLLKTLDDNKEPRINVDSLKKEKIYVSEYIYDAFICCRNVEPDRTIAKILWRSLETYKTPMFLQKQGIKPCLRRVFLDKEDLPTASDISEAMFDALRKSSFLIVVCSPDTPGSMWINNILRYFKDLGRGDRILTLLTKGESKESFPSELFIEKSRTIVDEGGKEHEIKESIEPLAADIRAKKTTESIRLLKVEKLRLLAPILGCSYSDLKRNRKRTLLSRFFVDI